MVRLAAEGRFETFGSQHLAALGVLAIGLFAVVWIGWRVRDTPAETRVSRTLAVGICAVTIPLQVMQFLPAEWNPRTSLPFQLCDLAWVFAVHALWTRSRLTTTVTYLWGITLTTQGMLTPDLAAVWPEPRFLMFWAMHILIVWAAVYLVVGLGIWPTWATYRRTVAITLVWAVLAFTYNAFAGVNYGYLNAKPHRASLLDLLGPWPLYVVLEIAIVAAVWALLTWPWTRREATAGVAATRSSA
ncbi:TIGR02206 family membrane protein [Mumia sp. DW29H23]|uniref:YwaF family protein n=1 Tax=Mumia sp. DW29H23 TaxID=3421241 RepID=UPI003D693E49